MKKKVVILTSYFCGWNGGIDLICYFLKAINYNTGKQFESTSKLLEYKLLGEEVGKQLKWIKNLKMPVTGRAKKFLLFGLCDKQVDTTRIIEI